MRTTLGLSGTYLTDETDPVFEASAAAGIESGDITAWDAAYGWGNHASAGYLTEFTELDPVFVAWEADAWDNLGLGAAAAADVGTGADDVAAGNHTHTGVY